MPAYLTGSTFFLVVWTVLYALAPRTRWYVLAASAGLTHFGACLESLYLADYWSPQYLWSLKVGGVTIAPEDYLFGFALSGLAAAVFELALACTNDEGIRRSFGQTWLRLQAAGAFFVIVNVTLVRVLGMNSVHATLLLCMLGAAWLYSRQPVWFVPGLTAGCVTAVLFLLFYELFFLQLYPSIIEDWWHGGALTGLRVRRVPIEEIAWAFAMGFFIGPLVRACATVSATDTNPLSALHAQRLRATTQDLRQTKRTGP
jgi:hypothetical protein